jgi:hypothetical protein
LSARKHVFAGISGERERFGEGQQLIWFLQDNKKKKNMNMNMNMNKKKIIPLRTPRNVQLLKISHDNGERRVTSRDS